MKITDIKVRKTNNKINEVKGYAEIIIDDCFVVHNIKIIEKEGSLFVAMPSRRTSNGEFKNIAHPINSEARELIQNEILREYEKCD